MTELPAVNHIISQENPESFDRLDWDLEMIGRHHDGYVNTIES